MKKIILTVATIFAFGVVNAQDLKSKKGENYLPEAGDWAISFNADGIFEYAGNAFNGNTNNNAPGVNYVDGFNGTFVGKKFISDKNAYRVIVNLGLGSGKTTTTNVINQGTPAEFTTTTETSLPSNGFDLALGLGKEWRKGKTRLQGFYGADALVFMNSNKFVQESSTTNTGTNTTAFVGNSKTEITSGMGLGLGVNGFIGAEYFIFPKMSIGAQYSWGVQFEIDGEGEQTVTNSSTGNPTTTVTTNLGKGSGFKIGGVGVSSINLTLHF